jgi:hypothetical protein
MPVKKMLIVCAALAASSLADAQAVYKCGAHSYSQSPCSSRVVHTYEAPVAVNGKPKDVVSRRLPGETLAQFNTRKKRVRLSESDRDECARLDKRIPVERERLKSPREDEVDDAQAAIDESRKRFRQLHC